MIYEFECGCGARESLNLQLDDDLLEQTCGACGERMGRVWRSVPFRVGFRAGYYAGAGQGFDSQQQRDEFYARNGLVVVEPEQAFEEGRSVDQAVRAAELLKEAERDGAEV